MDREDRDHFKTIQNQSAGQSIDSRAQWPKESSASRLDPAFYQAKAKAICGCYRRDEAQDPETFAAALAVVLADYPASIVEFAADPRTGVITKFPMGLPNIGQIKQFLDDAHNRQALLMHYSTLPKARPRAIAPPQKAQPNLFVPDTASRYQAMLKRHEKDSAGCSWRGSHQCIDGVTRNGLWVPLNWWDDPKTIDSDTLAEVARRAFERACADAGIDPAGGISPALYDLLAGDASQEGVLAE